MKKVLDNSAEPVYNIPKDVGGLITLHTSYEGRSKQTLKTMTDIGNWMKTVGRDKIPELPCPIIAGGSIRDLVLGYIPNDYDIFVDVSDLDQDEAEDLSFLYANYLAEGLNATEGVEEVGEAYKTMLPKGEWFEVWQLYPFGGLISAQVIVRKQKPVDTVNNFDYNLVKGYYDPLEEKFHLHEEMLSGIQNKEMIYDADKDNALKRFDRWIQRNRDHWIQRNRVGYSTYKRAPKKEKSASNNYETFTLSTS